MTWAVPSRSNTDAMISCSLWVHRFRKNESPDSIIGLKIMINAHFGIFLAKVLDLGLFKKYILVLNFFFIYREKIFAYKYFVVWVSSVILLCQNWLFSSDDGRNELCVCVHACRIDKIHSKFAGLLILKYYFKSILKTTILDTFYYPNRKTVFKWGDIIVFSL